MRSNNTTIIYGALLLVSILLSACGGGGSSGTPTLVSIAITPATASVAKGQITNFTATGTYNDGTTADITSQVSWTSGNISVATINSATGAATGVAVGSTTFTASVNGITSPTASLSVTVAVMTGLSISPITPSAPKGMPVTFTATATYSDDSSGNVSGSVIWASSDTSVATLNTSGIASTLAQGSTTVTASANGMISNSATLTVTAPVLIAVGISTSFILTDNATAATLTATLVDASNALMAGVPVSFSATTGNLSAATATTDANGQATVTLKSGLTDFTNRTATVTATVGGQSVSIPILIKGSTLALTLPTNTIQVGAGTITATATAADAGGLGKSNQTIRFSVGAASTGAGTLSAATLTTDATGVATPLTFTPTADGTVVLTAEWLNSAGAVTVTATKDIIVTAATGVAFAITLPTANPAALTTLTTQDLAVSVPPTIGTTAVASVRISVTGGTVTGTTQATAALTSITQTPAAIACPTTVTTNCVTATYTAPSYSGLVTIQVDALDVAGVSLSSLSRTFAISASSASAASLFLAASSSTIVPSSGTNISTAILEVWVRDAGLNAVGGAAVLFGLLGTTGSGESVSPAVVYTDSTGHAVTTFSAGSSATLATIYVQARVVGQICTFAPNPLVAEANAMCDTTPLIVAANAVSVTVGFGSTISDTANATQYMLPGSVLVVNANGSAAAGATVTLTVYPIEYRNGHIIPEQTFATTFNDFDCEGPYTTGLLPWVWPTPPAYVYTAFTVAEDVNRNGILELGEDTSAVLTPSQLAAQAVSNNGLLSPPQAAGGTVPLTVTTDSNGAATFFLQYPKSSAWFIKDEVTARVIVSGTESTAKMSMELPMSQLDAISDICPLAREGSY